MNNTIDKKQCLKNWLEQWGDLPEQGSQEWLDQRVNIIGGSELDKIIKGDYKSLFKSKMGLNRHPNTIAMVWGSVFEDIIRHISKLITGSNVTEGPGNIPSSQVQGKTYSMDGIGIVDFVTRGLLTVLFEYKCPWSRMLKNDNKIPKNYIPQVLSGMCDLEIPEIAIYMEGQFRCCSWNSLISEDHDFNRYIHYRGTNNQQILATGVAVFYIKNIDKSIKKMEEIKDINVNMLNLVFSGGTNENTDWGETTESDIKKMEKLFTLIRNGIIQISWSPLNFYADKFDQKIYEEFTYQPKSYSCDLKEFKDKVNKVCNTKKYTPLGFMGWKLFDFNTAIQEKTIDYTKQYEAKINFFLNNIKTIREEYDINNFYEGFNDKFDPKNKITFEKYKEWLSKVENDYNITDQEELNELANMLV